MRRAYHHSISAFLLIIVVSTPALALDPVASEFPNDKPVAAADWPVPVVEAVNGFRREYGIGPDGDAYHFYFKGDTADVNRFLQQVAREKVMPLSVVLTTDPGVEEAPALMFEAPKRVEFSWSLVLTRAMRELPFLIPRKGETDAQYQARWKVEEAELAKGPEFYVTVTIHCAGPIDSSRLEIPMRFDANVASRLDRLAFIHRERRADAAERQALPPAEWPPTTEALAATWGRSLFVASTQPTDQAVAKPATRPAGAPMTPDRRAKNGKQGAGK